MPLANSSGPEWLRGTELGRRSAPGWPNLIGEIFRSIRLLFSGSRRRPKTQREDEGDIGSLSGGNAERLEDEPKL